MPKLTFIKLAIIFAFLFCCAFSVKYVFAETPTSIPFDESTIGGSELKPTGSTYGDTWHFTVAVPSGYTKSSIKLEVSASPSCLEAYIKSPCTSSQAGTNSPDSCTTPALAGQQVNFDVEVYFGYCGSSPGIFSVKASEPPTLKSNGVSCSLGSECKGGYCVHGKCWSASARCGDNYCDSGETCSSINYQTNEVSGCSDCGACKNPDGSKCTFTTECTGGYCVWGICRSSSSYCGDNHCDSGLESCFYCPTDCGACPVVKKENGQSCKENSECKNGYCVHEYCRSDYVYCGDTFCDSGESCSSCSTDCGSCPAQPLQEVVTQPTPVQEQQPQEVAPTPPSQPQPVSIMTPTQEPEVVSQPLQKIVKTYKIKTIVDINVKENGFAAQKIQMIYAPATWKEEMKKNPLTSKYLREMEKSITASYKREGLAVKKVEVSVDKARYTLVVSVDFANYAELGKLRGFMDFKDLIVIDLNSVSLLSSSCKKDDYSVDITGNNRIIMNAVCTESFSYQSGDIINETQIQFAIRQNVNLPAKAGEVEFNKESFIIYYKIIQPKKDIGGKCLIADECKSGNCKNGKCAKFSVLDVSLPKSITLKKGEKYKLPISIKNVSQMAVTVSEYVMLGDLPKFISGVYSNALRIYRQNLEPGEEVSTKSEQQEDSIEVMEIEGETAGSGKITLWFDYSSDKGVQKFSATVPIEVKNIHIARDATATALFKQNMILVQKKDKYVFVVPEDNAKITASIERWRTARAAFNQGVDTLVGQAEDAFKPDLLSFAETIQNMTRQETPQKITETLIKSLVPSQVQAGANFFGMMTPFRQQQVEEAFLLKTFGVKNLTNISNYDGYGQFIGYTVAITKEKGGKIYAVALGDF